MKTHLLLKEIIPSLSTENVANSELKQVKREKEYDTIKPDYSGPAPADALYPCKAPVSIDSDDSSHLPGRKEGLARV